MFELAARLIAAFYAWTHSYTVAIGRSFGNAVARNRIRRRLRVLLAGHADRLQPGLYLVGAQPSLDGSSAQVLASSVADLDTQISKRYE